MKEDIAGHQKDIEGSKNDLERIQEGYKQDITGYKENIKSLNSEIERLQAVIMNTPDPLELSRLQVRAEELEKHIQTLKGELEKAGRREDDLKAVHNNYMLQVQSLINQKAIEAPGEKKKW